MKKYFLPVLLACTLLTGSANAQKVITFESKPIKKGAHKLGEGANSLTLGVGSFMNGYTAIYYERRAFPFMSVAVGGGFTYRSYMNDFGMLIWDDGQNSEYSSTRDIHDHYAAYKFRKATPGLYASISPKFYFNDEPLDGFYLAPMLEIKQYKFDARLADVTAPPDNSYSYDYSDESVPHSAAIMPEHMNCLDLTFNSGGHYQLKNHLALGWNVGIGFRSISAERLDITTDDASGSLHYVNNVHSYTATRPLFLFNFTMGGWF